MHRDDPAPPAGLCDKSLPRPRSDLPDDALRRFPSPGGWKGSVRAWWAWTSLLFQKIRQQPLALFSQKAFRMKVHALERPGRVAHTHDLVMVGPTADLELRRQGAVADDQAVIAG